MVVSSGGTASNIDVLSAGAVHVYAGGMLMLPMIHRDGVVVVHSGGCAKGVSFNGGTLVVESSAVAHVAAYTNGTITKHPGGAIAFGGIQVAPGGKIQEN